MIPRHLKTHLLDLASDYAVITLTGPRQSGKTTLAKSTFTDFSYVSLEDPEERKYAEDDPKGFLSRFSDPVIIDEVQHVPDLFSYIQVRIDEVQEGGLRYLLTGSQEFLLLEQVSQSLAGRAAITHLLPLSLSELSGRSQLTLEGLLEPESCGRRRVSEKLFDVLFSGFYPRIHDRGLDPQEWLSNYYQTYVQRDVRTILNVGDLSTFDRFVRMCAGRVGQIVNLSSLGADCGVSHTTARRWISVLAASFIVAEVPPHHRNFGKRLTKSPKLMFLDAGLLCYLLGITSPDQLHHHPLRGGIFESFVFSELMKASVHRGRDHRLHYWRDHRGREIDFVLEQGSQLIGVETKSGMTLASDALSNLRWWEDLAGDECLGTCLIYGGDEPRRWKGTSVLPWSCL